MIKSNLFAVWKSKERDLGRRLTYSEVSEATGISRTTLSCWMNAKVKRFSSSTIAALASFFGCNVSDLIVKVNNSKREEV